MDFAIIKTGGKQYKVSLGQKIKIEKLEIAEGNEVVFDEVLLVEKDEEMNQVLSPPKMNQVLSPPKMNQVLSPPKIEIGAPIVKGAKVVGKVLKRGKSKKVTIRKYKSKKRYDVKRGHRQPYTEVEITDIQ